MSSNNSSNSNSNGSGANIYNGSSSGGLWNVPVSSHTTTSTAAGGPWISTTGYNHVANNFSMFDYYILKLPNKKIPTKIYVSGMVKTLGAFGTAAEVAILSEANKKLSLCFSKKAFGLTLYNYSDNEISLVLEYKKHILYYSMSEKPGSRILKAKFISKVKK